MSSDLERLRRHVSAVANKIAVDPSYSRDAIVTDLRKLSLPPEPAPWWICFMPLGAGVIAGFFLHFIANVPITHSLLSGTALGGFLSLAFLLIYFVQRWEYRRAVHKAG